MKPTRKQPLTTRRTILEAAGKRFARGGLSATGIGVIVQDAGWTKGALFYHFADKRALVLAWINEMLADGVRESWVEPLAEVDSLEQLIVLMRRKCEELSVDDPVSVMVAVVAEVGPVDPAMAEALQGVMGSWRAAITEVLERGQSGSWVHRSIEPAVEAGILVAMFCGLAVAGRCSVGDSSGRDAARAMVAYLDTLRPQ